MQGVRKAVTEVATEYSMNLHVEQGQCWTFSASFIKTTKNTSEDISNLAEATNIVQQAEADVDGWVQNIGLLVRGDEDLDTLRKTLNGHGKEYKDGRWVSHSKTWIDKGGRDKRVSILSLLTLDMHKKPNRFNAASDTADACCQARSTGLCGVDGGRIWC